MPVLEDIQLKTQVEGLIVGQTVTVLSVTRGTADGG